jgi:hypothetical protein
MTEITDEELQKYVEFKPFHERDHKLHDLAADLLQAREQIAALQKQLNIREQNYARLVVVIDKRIKIVTALTKQLAEAEEDGKLGWKFADHRWACEFAHGGEYCTCEFDGALAQHEAYLHPQEAQNE